MWIPQAQRRLRLSGALSLVERSQRHQHRPAEWEVAWVQMNGTQIALNGSKPGLEKKGKQDARHAIRCTVNIWSELMNVCQGASL